MERDPHTKYPCREGERIGGWLNLASAASIVKSTSCMAASIVLGMLVSDPSGSWMSKGS